MSKKLWKGYAIVMCAFTIWSLLSSGLDVTSLGVSIFNAVGLIGLYGYIFNTGIGHTFMWKIYFGLLAFWMSAFAVFSVTGLVSHFELGLALGFGLLLGVQMPLFYALWAYVYKSKELWQKNV